jgi:hypothetical protein
MTIINKKRDIKMKKMKIFLFLIIFSFLVNSQPTEAFGYEIEPLELRSVEQCMAGCNAPIYTNWLYYIVTIAAIVFAIIAIVYMVGRMLNKPDYEALAKLELWQTLNALIWVFIIVLPFVTLSCRATCYAAKGNPYEIAQDYVSNLKDKIEDHIVKLISKAKEIRYVSGIQILIPPSTNCFEGACAFIYAGCGTLADNYESLALFLYPFLGSLVVQQLALVTFSILFSIILPIGLILRLIPRLREAGAFLIALALAIFIVFPLTYVFAKKATQLGLAEVPSFSYNWDIACKFFGYGGSGFKDFVKYMYEIGKILPQAVFFPALSTIITLASARAMSKIFLYDFIGG